MVGQITKNISNAYTVTSSDASKTEYICHARGRFRNEKITPLVGDFVEFDAPNLYILEMLPRKNELNRPSICNVDQAFVVVSFKEPNFSPNLLDKMLVILEYNQVEPIICFTKVDLLDKTETKELKDAIKYYEEIGYTVFKNNELNKIKQAFKDKLTVFTGQTGVGKSTLLNKLDKNLNLKTNGISKALGRGKHTTRHVELYRLYDGLVADTPGFSALEFTDMSNEDIRDNFVEFHRYGQNCKYRDCIHHNEDGCHVKELVQTGVIKRSRYENYLKFLIRK